MKYVIRSMSTSDYNGRDPVIPYQIFLLPREQRRGAYWARSGAQIFDTLEEAEADWLRIWPEGKCLGSMDIAPLGHPVPVWEEIHYQPQARIQA